MEAWDNIAHQIVLLAINPRTGKVRKRTDLALAAAGGALAELALQERVSLVKKKVEVNDPRPTEDPLLDTMLAVLERQGRRRPTRILNAARGAYRDQALAELVTHGWVQMSPATIGNRYEILDHARYERIRSEATQALLHPDEVPARQACLGGLAAQLSLMKELAPELGLLERGRVRRILEKRDWVVKAMHDVMAARQAATAAAAS
ncbi:MAG: GPP34 family phosphoprotein [Brooklawnia sp.]|jgi:hypothetical protein